MYADTEQAELATWEHDERVAAGMEPDGRAVAHLPLRWALSGEILGTYLPYTGSRKAKAARILGIDVKTLNHKIKVYHIAC